MNSDAILSLIIIILFVVFGILLVSWIFSFIMYTWNSYVESKANQIHVKQHLHHEDDRDEDEDRRRRREEEEYSMPPPSSVPRSARSRSRSRARSRY